MYRNLTDNFMQQALACLLIFLTTALSPVAQQQEARAKRNLVFTGVNVINPIGAPLQTDMTVIVRDGRIVGLGKTGRIRIPKDARIVDARGKFLIPGLWDMHAHLGTSADVR